MKEFYGVLEKCHTEGPSFDLIRLRNDALAAKAVLIAAIERKSSVGAHIRSDAVLTNEEKYRIILNNENGEITVKRETVK